MKVWFFAGATVQGFGEGAAKVCFLDSDRVPVAFELEYRDLSLANQAGAQCRAGIGPEGAELELDRLLQTIRDREAAVAIDLEAANDTTAQLCRSLENGRGMPPEERVNHLQSAIAQAVEQFQRAGLGRKARRANGEIQALPD